MKLRRLNKSEDSWQAGDCPAMYLGDDPAWMVCQGRHLDAETAGELRAAALVLAEHGQPTMRTEVEAFLVERPQGAHR